MKALPEIRDWASFALGLLGVLLAWRYRNRPITGIHHVLELHDTVTATDSVVVRPAMLELSPAHGTSSVSLALTTGRPPLDPVPITGD